MVAIPVTDMWQNPKFESGRVSQSLAGQILRAVKSKAGYVFCYDEDNYSGWVRKSHLIDIPKDATDIKTAYIKSYSATLMNTANSGKSVLRLSYGSTVYYDRCEGDSVHLVFPSGWLRKADVALKRNPAKTFNPILRDLKLFLGTPYLWGGKSCFGIDCSGLVQLVYNFHGCDLPRDSRDQALCGSRVARKNIKPGDLIFSPGHVCVHIGKEKILHANTKNGLVNIESIDKNSSFYRRDIAENIKLVRRVL